MKLLSTYELARYSNNELSALFHDVWIEVVRTSRGSPERRNALASLENIDRVRSNRRYGCLP
jgi:hypothetical protein